MYHLDEVVSTGKFVNIIGYIINNSHNNPTIENGYLVPITQNDLDSGVVYTNWGVFKLSSNNDGLLSISKDSALASPEKLLSQSDLDTNKTVPMGTFKIFRNAEYYDYQFEDLEALPLKRHKVETTQTQTL